VVIIRTAEGGRNAVTDTVIVRFDGDGSGVAELESRADSHFVSPADMAALMRRIEDVLVDAAVRDTAFEGAALGDTAVGGTSAVPAMGAVR
jgi:cyanophycinase-like exopeptidase